MKLSLFYLKKLETRQSFDFIGGRCALAGHNVVLRSKGELGDVLHLAVRVQHQHVVLSEIKWRIVDETASRKTSIVSCRGAEQPPIGTLYEDASCKTP